MSATTILTNTDNYNTAHESMKDMLNQDYDLEEVLHYIDSVQYTPEELNSLQDLIYYIHTSKMTDEWESFDTGIKIGDFDKDPNELEYFRMLDRQEMYGDMYAFEDENETHQMFAMNPWESRTQIPDYDKANKRSEITIDATVTHVGENYSTATSKYGKVFIPRPCGLNLPVASYKEGEVHVSLRVRFQGFEGCRKTAMPWRAIAIISINN